MGIVIDSSGVINVAASTPGTYRITYTLAGTCPSSSFQDVTINALDNAAFSYSANSYSTTGADPTPTITGLTGGTFSGSTGLVINSTTGEIDLSASTAASHTVTYNTTSSSSSVCPNTSTFNLAIVINQIANNYSMNFDSASSDYINAGNLNSINGLQKVTYSFWMNDSSGGASYPIGTDGQLILMPLINSNRFDVYLNGTSTSARIYNNQTLTVLNTNQWHHIVLVIDSTLSTANQRTKLYIDGNAYTDASGTAITQNATIGTVTTDTNIGRASGSSPAYFNGQIDEVAIWDTALTSTQIADIYNAKGTNLTKYLTTVSGSNLKYWNRMGD